MLCKGEKLARVLQISWWFSNSVDYYFFYFIGVELLGRFYFFEVLWKAARLIVVKKSIG